MKIDLDSESERRLVELAQISGRTVDEVLVDLVHKGLALSPTTAKNSSAEAQRLAIENLLAEIDRLPIGNPDDGFNAADHDKIIYRRDW